MVQGLLACCGVWFGVFSSECGGSICGDGSLGSDSLFCWCGFPSLLIGGWYQSFRATSGGSAEVACCSCFGGSDDVPGRGFPLFLVGDGWLCRTPPSLVEGLAGFVAVLDGSLSILSGDVGCSSLLFLAVVWCRLSWLWALGKLVVRVMGVTGLGPGC